MMELNISLNMLFQVLIAEKESKIAEMDAASSGEAARLRAAMETVKGELVHLKHEHVWVKLFSKSKCHFLIYIKGPCVNFLF